MARQQKVFVSGKIGSVIFYERNGVQCARSAPAHVKQTKATRQSAKIFGRAKQIGRSLRVDLSPVLAGFKARTIMHRLDNAIRQWLKETNAPGEDLPFINGLELNERAALKERIKVSLSVDFSEKGKVMLKIPGINLAKDVQAPSNTRSLQLSIGLASCLLPANTSAGSFSTSLDIPFKTGSMIPEQKIILPFDVKKGSITLVVATLLYSIEKKGKSGFLMDERWMPAAVVGSCSK